MFDPERTQVMDHPHGRCPAHFKTLWLSHDKKVHSDKSRIGFSYSIERILVGIEFKPIKKNTITDLEKLRVQSYSTRRRGYAISFEETDSAQ